MLGTYTIFNNNPGRGAHYIRLLISDTFEHSFEYATFDGSCWSPEFEATNLDDVIDHMPEIYRRRARIDRDNFFANDLPLIVAGKLQLEPA